MPAALLLNLGGGGQPPTPPAVVAGFGGGRFWRRYGHDREWDPYRRSLEEEPEVIQPEPVMVKLVVPNRSVYNPTRRVVSEEVVRRLEEQFVRANEEDELMTIFALLS